MTLNKEKYTDLSRDELIELIETISFSNNFRLQQKDLKQMEKVWKRALPLIRRLSPTLKIVRLIKHRIDAAIKKKPKSHTVSSKSSPVRIAVFLHLYYPELADEFIDQLKNIPTPFKLFVNIPSGDLVASEKFKSQFNTKVLSYPNKGRDIGSFIEAINKTDILSYTYICKIHSKKSLHQSEGDLWRKAMVKSLLGSKKRVIEIISLLSSNNGIGMVGPSPFLVNLYNDPLNDELISQTMRNLNLNLSHYQFFAGTMFWVSSTVMQNSRLKSYDTHSFPTEENRGSYQDGLLDHAFERIFGALCLSKNLKIKTIPVNPLDSAL